MAVGGQRPFSRKSLKFLLRIWLGEPRVAAEVCYARNQIPDILVVLDNVGNNIQISLDGGRQYWSGLGGRALLLGARILQAQVDKNGAWAGDFVLEAGEQEPGMDRGEFLGFWIFAERESDPVKILWAHPNLPPVTNAGDLGHLNTGEAGDVCARDRRLGFLDQLIDSNCDIAHILVFYSFSLFFKFFIDLKSTFF